jgi:hypothetical protein
MGKTSYAVHARYKAKTYKKKEINLSIPDSMTIEEYCKENNISFNNLVYRLLIDYMHAHGVNLVGTATLHPSEVIDEQRDDEIEQ